MNGGEAVASAMRRWVSGALSPTPAGIAPAPRSSSPAPQDARHPLQRGALADHRQRLASRVVLLLQHPDEAVVEQAGWRREGCRRARWGWRRCWRCDGGGAVRIAQALGLDPEQPSGKQELADVAATVGHVLVKVDQPETTLNR